MSLLQVRDLEAGYDGLTILHGVSLAVERAQLVAIVGPNGAGKSTLLKAVFGLLPASGGSVSFDGEEVTRLSPGDRLRRGIGLVPQGRNIFPLMTVERNLELGGHVLGADALRAALDDVYARFPLLRARRRQRARELSGGQLQLLQVARALLLRPRLLLVDEPSLGLSPAVLRDVFALLDGVRRDGVGVLMVEQNAHKALEMADYAYVLELGTNRYEGPGPRLRDDERVKRLYLGGR